MADVRQGVTRPFDTPAELEEYRQKQLREYSEWVATVDIFVGFALAYRAGDPVPSSNVAAHGYDKNGLVRPAKAEPAKKKEEGK